MNFRDSCKYFVEFIFHISYFSRATVTRYQLSNLIYFLWNYWFLPALFLFSVFNSSVTAVFHTYVYLASS